MADKYGRNRKPWQRLAQEQPDDYALFLYFRNLGPNRTLRGAFKQWTKQFANAQANADGRKIPEPPTRWRRLYREMRWLFRASAWDIAGLKKVGAKLVTLQSQTIVNLAKKTHRAALDANLVIEGIPDLLNAIKTVQCFITPEVVQGVCDRYRGDDPDELREPIATGLDSVE